MLFFSQNKKEKSRYHEALTKRPKSKKQGDSDARNIRVTRENITLLFEMCLLLKEYIHDFFIILIKDYSFKNQMKL